MAIEIEKKYRLTKEQCQEIAGRLKSLGALRSDTEFEVNSLYTSPALDLDGAILRLRRVGNRAVLTFKKRFSSSSSIKRQLEEETDVADAEAMERILVRLGFKPSLVYEKRRETWNYGATEITIDELPFGWFMEIEGQETDIERIERELELDSSTAEEETYPALTRHYGKVVGDITEARFD
jgi:adenylate cyclase class 2